MDCHTASGLIQPSQVLKYGDLIVYPGPNRVRLLDFIPPLIPKNDA